MPRPDPHRPPRPGRAARTGVGPAAYGEFERIFGSRITERWPSHRVVDGLDQIEILLDTDCLLIHPRCIAFENGLPELCPRPAARRRVARRADAPAPPRGPDGRAPGRHPRPVPRRPDRATQVSYRPLLRAPENDPDPHSS